MHWVHYNSNRFSLQNNNNNNNNDNNNNNNNVNAANSNTNQANMNTVMAGRRRDIATEHSARAERVRRILSQHHRAAAHSMREVRSLKVPSKECVLTSSGHLPRVGVDAGREGYGGEKKAANAKEYSLNFSSPDRTLRKTAGISTSDGIWRRFEDSRCGDSGTVSELQSEVLNQTTVAALAYLDFFLANVASDPDPV